MYPQYFITRLFKAEYHLTLLFVIEIPCRVEARRTFLTCCVNLTSVFWEESSQWCTYYFGCHILFVTNFLDNQVCAKFTQLSRSLNYIPVLELLFFMLLLKHSEKVEFSFLHTLVKRCFFFLRYGTVIQNNWNWINSITARKIFLFICFLIMLSMTKYV
jgi:hypothetical protein